MLSFEKKKIFGTVQRNMDLKMLKKTADEVQEEIGDIIFTINARFLGISADDARKSNVFISG